MSGHSKWAKIKRDKGSKDAQRGVLFSQLSKRLTVAAKAGGSPDPTLNFQLRTEIEAAKAKGLPSDNIDRAIKRAFDKNAAALTENTYEGYGPFGTAFLVETATDNPNRTVSNIKHYFSKAGGSLGSQGSVAWQFETRGQILIEKTVNSLPAGKAGEQKIEELEMMAIELGAEDVKESEEGLEVYTKPQELERIKNSLVEAGAEVVQAEVVKESTQPVELAEEQKEKVAKLFDTLSDDEDVTAVYTNASI